MNKIRPEVAVIQEPFGNAVHASTAVDLRGKSVAIFGCGAIGQFTIMIAKALGASRVIGIEPNPDQRRAGAEAGRRRRVEFEIESDDDRNGWKAYPEVVEQVVRVQRYRRRRRRDGDGRAQLVGQQRAASVRRGGDVVLFGLKSGDFKIQDFQRNIVKGIVIHSVIGRRLFETWELTKNLLESRENGIQDKIWNVMLNRGKDTIVDAKDFDPATFEKKIGKHPKLIIRW